LSSTYKLDIPEREAPRVEDGPTFIKRGYRMLGVAESFRKHSGEKSVLAGVVMRADFIVDGFSIAFPTVGGMDATDSLLTLYRALGREDINIICVGGSVISWYNVIDFHRFHREVEKPIISLTYEESPGLEEHFKRNFPRDWRERVEIYRRNGERTPLKLKTDFEVFIRTYDLTISEAAKILDVFTLQGRFPEPVRLARTLSHSVAEGLLKVGLLSSQGGKVKNTFRE
jgi:endonuclease V-like protein UPF0215 family